MSFDLDAAKELAASDRVGVISGCEAAAQLTPDMTVAVAAGQVVFGYGQPRVTVPAGNVTISAADDTDDRLDLVCVDGDGHLTIATGQPAASPLYPNPDGRIVLATITVAAEAETIETGDISDQRVLLNLGAVPDAAAADPGDLLTADGDGGYTWEPPA